MEFLPRRVRTPLRKTSTVTMGICDLMHLGYLLALEQRLLPCTPDNRQSGQWLRGDCLPAGFLRFTRFFESRDRGRRLSAQATRFTFCHRSDRNRVIVQFRTRRGRFTDKGTPGVILGRKAKAFEICDFDL